MFTYPCVAFWYWFSYFRVHGLVLFFAIWVLAYSIVHNATWFRVFRDVLTSRERSHTSISTLPGCWCPPRDVHVFCNVFCNVTRKVGHAGYLSCPRVWLLAVSRQSTCSPVSSLSCAAGRSGGTTSTGVAHQYEIEHRVYCESPCESSHLGARPTLDDDDAHSCARTARTASLLRRHSTRSPHEARRLDGCSRARGEGAQARQGW